MHFTYVFDWSDGNYEEYHVKLVLKSVLWYIGTSVLQKTDKPVISANPSYKLLYSLQTA